MKTRTPLASSFPALLLAVSILSVAALFPAFLRAAPPPSWAYAIQVQAEVSASPNVIKLVWRDDYVANGSAVTEPALSSFTIHLREAGQTMWVQVNNPVITYSPTEHKYEWTHNASPVP